MVGNPRTTSPCDWTHHFFAHSSNRFLNTTPGNRRSLTRKQLCLSARRLPGVRTPCDSSFDLISSLSLGSYSLRFLQNTKALRGGYCFWGVALNISAGHFIAWLCNKRIELWELCQFEIAIMNHVNSNCSQTIISDNENVCKGDLKTVLSITHFFFIWKAVISASFASPEFWKASSTGGLVNSLAFQNIFVAIRLKALLATDSRKYINHSFCLPTPLYDMCF